MNRETLINSGTASKFVENEFAKRCFGWVLKSPCGLRVIEALDVVTASSASSLAFLIAPSKSLNAFAAASTRVNQCFHRCLFGLLVLGVALAASSCATGWVYGQVKQDQQSVQSGLENGREGELGGEGGDGEVGGQAGQGGQSGGVSPWMLAYPFTAVWDVVSFPFQYAWMIATYMNVDPLRDSEELRETLNNSGTASEV